MFTPIPHSNIVTPVTASRKRSLEIEDNSNKSCRTKLVFNNNETIKDLTDENEEDADAQQTQPVDYEPNLQASLMETCDAWQLRDVHARNITVLKNSSAIKIGRMKLKTNHQQLPNDTCTIYCQSNQLSRNHASLDASERYALVLEPRDSSCWIWSRIDKKWKELSPGMKWSLLHGNRFRLLPPTKDEGANNRQGVEFEVSAVNGTHPVPAGSASFDCQYLQLLALIQSDGQFQNNKKGRNRTLRQTFDIHIDLHHPDPETNLLPISTLRQIFHMQAITEAIWYLRGDDDIAFLKKHKCKFWDKQARDDGWVGLNYGLLTNFPRSNRTKESNFTLKCNQKVQINQLEECIHKLCRGENSRNMVCTLLKPDESTVQSSCTSSIQFSVSNDTLDLTVFQRSSDVILGLPNDVVAWSVIYHLVRREVQRRSNSKRILKSGKVHFSFSSGAVHAYLVNEGAFNTLLKRKPIRSVQPELHCDVNLGIFELAKQYDKEKMKKPWLRVPYYHGNYHPKIQLFQALENDR